MWVQDEIKDYGKYESLSFIDFLEGVGRVAHLKALPTFVDLERLGYSDVFEWSRARDTSIEDLKEDVAEEERRPLSEKLEVFLDLVFRMLHYDPSQPESEFSHDALLKIIKKKDKELGP